MDIKPLGVRKGAWTPEEDHLLKTCVDKYGEGKWHQIPLQAGLNRCRKSCRLRWLNYLKPNIKRGNFSGDEIDLMIRLHKLLGNRWSLIAGRLPGRTSNDVKNYWNTHLKKKSIASQKTNPQMSKEHKIFRPQPRAFSINLQWLQSKTTTTTADHIQTKDNFVNSSPVSALCGDGTSWWDEVAVDVEINVGNNCWFEDGSTAEPPIVGVWDERKGPGEGESRIQESWSGWGDIVIDDVELWDLNNF